jgi:hypothetical protein
MTDTAEAAEVAEETIPAGEIELESRFAVAELAEDTVALTVTVGRSSFPGAVLAALEAGAVPTFYATGKITWDAFTVDEVGVELEED